MVAFRIYKKAGKYQTLSLVLFMLAAICTAIAIAIGFYSIAVLGGVIIIANLVIFQMNSRIIERHFKQH